MKLYDRCRRLRKKVWRQAEKAQLCYMGLEQIGSPVEEGIV